MILWLDDDIGGIRPFKDELEDAGYEVLQTTNPDVFYQKLEELLPKIVGIIMDIMLPTGQSVSQKESGSGIRSGLLIMQKLKSEERYLHLPIIVLTIVDDQDVIDWANDNNIEVLYKLETYPLELKQKVQDFFGPVG
jgi:CheY-like chemotaxis protein